jgi:peptide-methionine (S)-S-oxide reductase
MPTAETALAGRDAPAFTLSGVHAVLGTSILPPHPEGTETAIVAMGCFWGAERLFWQLPGVHTTAVGYSGGFTPHPTYEEACSGLTGHAEAVLVVFHPDRLRYRDVLQVFFDEHDPTQGMRQGNDVGTQYRSALYWADDAQRAVVEATRDAFATRLADAGFGGITTEVGPRGEFFYAEDHHQQYLHKVPNGYCGLGGTGVSCPVGLPEEDR